MGRNIEVKPRPMQGVEVAQYIRQIQTLMEQDRLPYEEGWRNYNRLFKPYQYDLAHFDPNRKHWGDNIFDFDPQLVLRTFSVGFVGYTTPKNQDWLKLAIPNARAMYLDNDIQEYLQNCAEQLSSAVSRSNFYEISIPAAEDVGVTGTAFITPEYDWAKAKTLFRKEHPGDCFMQCDGFGRVQRIHRIVEMNVLEIVEFFEGKNIPDKVADDYQAGGGRLLKKYKFIHAQYYNPSPRANSLRPEDKKIKSVYVPVDGPAEVTRDSGRDTMTIAWALTRQSRETYGMGIAALAWYAANINNTLSERMLRRAHLEVETPMFVPKEYKGKWRMLPGKNLYYDKPERKAEPLWTGGSWPVSAEERERISDAMKEFFFYDFFRVLMAQENLKDVTAYAVSQLQGEKGIILGAYQDSQERGQLDPMIDVLWEDELRAGRMPEPPESLMALPDAEIRAEYEGQLAVLRRQLFQVRGIQQGLQSLEPLAKFFPAQVAQKLDPYRVIEATLDSAGMPQDLIRSDEEAQELAMIEAKQQAANQQLAMAAEAAKAVPNLSKPVEAGSPLETIMGQM
jgi:hypothetical protein